MIPLATIAPRNYRRELYRYLMRRVHQPQDVNDLAQEVYLRLTSMTDDRRVDKPLAYLYGIASHVLADFRLEAELEHAHVTVDSEALDEHAEKSPHFLPDDLADRLNLQQQIDRALAKLPPTHAAVILLHKRDGKSYDEVAAELGLSIHTVEKYVTQAKARIRAMVWDR